MDHLGHHYILRNRRRDWVYYSCKYRVRFNCPGSIKRQGDVIEIIREHNGHLVPVDNVADFRRTLVERAVQERISLREIYDQEAARNPDAAVLYAFPAAYSTMKSARRRRNPPIPATLTELGNLLENDDAAFSIIIDGGPEQFFRRRIEADGGTALFFSAQSFINIAVAGVEEMHLDGTFKCVPVAPPSHQLLTIHVIKYEKSIALAYVLMTHRRQPLYEAVLQVLQEFAPTLQPLRIMTDYERALRGALVVSYPAAEIVGCFFHYASAVWKMCARLGHIANLEHHPDKKKAIKMTMALPLLPENAIEPGLEAIMAWCGNRQINLGNLFAYIRRFWINTVHPEHLSVFGMPRRTNNNVEAYNKILLIKMGIHPNIFVFIENLVKLQKRSYLDIRTLENGLRVTRPVPERYLAQDIRVRDAQRLFLEGVYTTIHFLEVMSHAVENIAVDMHQGHVLHQRDEDVIDVEDLDAPDAAVVDIRAPQADVPGPEADIAAPEANIAAPEAGIAAPQAVVPALQPEPARADSPQPGPSHAATVEGEPVGNRSVCVVCQEEQPTHASVPCGHRCVCQACSDGLVQRGHMRCPTCRGEVFMYMQVF